MKHSALTVPAVPIVAIAAFFSVVSPLLCADIAIDACDIGPMMAKPLYPETPADRVSLMRNFLETRVGKSLIQIDPFWNAIRVALARNDADFRSQVLSPLDWRWTVRRGNENAIITEEELRSPDRLPQADQVTLIREMIGFGRHSAKGVDKTITKRLNRLLKNRETSLQDWVDLRGQLKPLQYYSTFAETSFRQSGKMIEEFQSFEIGRTIEEVADNLQSPVAEPEIQDKLKSAIFGNDPNAQEYVGRMYETGLRRNASKDLPKAARWYKLSAENPFGSRRNWSGLAKAQLRLAALHEHGNGVDQNDAEAYAWYNLAARSGSGEAKLKAERLKSTVNPPTLAYAAARLDELTAKNSRRSLNPKAYLAFLRREHESWTPWQRVVALNRTAAWVTALTPPTSVLALRIIHGLGYATGSKGIQFLVLIFASLALWRFFYVPTQLAINKLISSAVANNRPQ